MPQVTGAGGQVYISARLNKAFDQAFEEAERLKDEYISAEHFLIVFTDRVNGAAHILNRHGVSKMPCFRCCRVSAARNGLRIRIRKKKYQALTRYGRDLTELARKGKLDPVIGRDEEIRRVMQVLCAVRKIIRFDRRTRGRENRNC